MSEGLKSCPFCGGKDLYLVGHIDGSTYYSGEQNTVGIFCNWCKQTVILEENEMEGINDATRAKAIAAWNRRAR